MIAATAPSTPITDVNVSLSRYPFRRLPLDEPQTLVPKLRSLNITQAWTGSFDALLHRDIAAVNERLFDDCRRHGQGVLIPFGAINLMLPDWLEDMRRCHEIYRFPGVRLHPNYHGYKLDHPAFVQLLEQATKRDLIVQLTDHIEDDRTLHPLVRVAPVDFSPLIKLMPQFPATKLILLNALKMSRGEPLASFSPFANVHLDITALEQVGGIRSVLDRFPATRLLFGSHAPFFYPESSVLKLQESALSGEALNQICHENALHLLGT